MSTVLITGGHGGIGLECSKHLAQRKFDIILAGRSPEQMSAAAVELQSTYGVRVFAVPVDVSSLTSVRAFAAEIRALHANETIGALNAIICNAGIAGKNPITYSADGYEITFATNCLGHFLLTHLLLGLLDVDGRVVFTASGTHDPDTGDGRVGSVVEPDARQLAFQGKGGQKPVPAQSRYSTSKLCTILYAYELDRRLRRSNSTVGSIAFDPGGIPESSLGRGLPKPVQVFIRTRFAKWLMKRMGVNVGSLSVAGPSLAALAVDSAYAHASGKYFQANDRTLRERKSSTLSYDQDRAARLWEDSRGLVQLLQDEEPSELRSPR